jgi:hypothetical protein
MFNWARCVFQTQKVNQEDVSAWMTGIVEVPLSVDHKLKNVEETEVAKKRLLESAGGVMPGWAQRVLSALYARWEYM